MLSKTLETSMKKAMKYENLTRASRFAKIDDTLNDEKSLEKEFLMLQKISDYVKEDIESQNNDISDVIVQSLDLEEQLTDETEYIPRKLPFFRAIQSKLLQEFSV